MKPEEKIPCSEAEFLISLRIDGELLEQMEARLDAHLSMCSACRTVAEKDAALSRILRRTLETGQATLLALEERVLSRRHAPAIDSPRKRCRTRRLFPGPRSLIAVAAAALVALGLWRLVSFNVPNTEQSESETAAVLLFEKGDHRIDILPQKDGTPTGVQTRRVKTLLTDSPHEKEREPSGNHHLILEVERVDRRYFQLVSSPWY